MSTVINFAILHNNCSLFAVNALTEYRQTLMLCVVLATDQRMRQ